MSTEDMIDRSHASASAPEFSMREPINHENVLQSSRVKEH